MKALLVPYPEKIAFAGGCVSLPQDLSLYEESPSPCFRAIMAELQARRAPDAVGASVRLLSPGSAPRALRRWAEGPESYAMRVADNEVSVWAASGAGHLYGVMTLRQLLRQHGRHVPCVAIGDRPALARRGVQLSFPQGHTGYRHEYMRRLVPQLARWKLNELYLYLESYFDFPSMPHFAGPDAMTPAQAVALDKLCRSYNIKLIPMLNCLAHCGELLATQRYNHLTEHPRNKDRRLVGPFNLCASSAEVNAVVDGMLEDLCSCFSSDAIHVGGDEVSRIGECPRCRRGGREPGAFSLYTRYFGRIFNVLARSGRKGGIWGDMLLHYCPEMPKREQARLFDQWRDKAIIYDWHYSGGSRQTLDFFVKAGMETIACSSTHLCYLSALWPAQAMNQRELFRDAADAGAGGGMTTGWLNLNGLHEEHFNYLHASGAAMLWSGAGNGPFAGNMDKTTFEAAYSLHRYGIGSKALTRYLHVLGDAKGPVLGALASFHGVDLRKCLYHTDNILDFWALYSEILSGQGLQKYKRGVEKARRLWNGVGQHPAVKSDPDFWCLAGPLLMHEHLIARYEMTEAVYACYDRAARLQYEDTARFRALLDRCAALVEGHLRDFKPIEQYLARGRAALGFDLSTLNRVRATRDNARRLAAFFRHLKKSHRPLPVFQQLHNVFLGQRHTRFYYDREHEWAAESPEFRRYSLNEPGPWAPPIIDAAKEVDARP